MRKFILHITVLLFLFLLFSCEKKNVSFCLSQAEDLMDSHPDSAYRLLRQIAHPGMLSHDKQAKYNLLNSIAMLNNNILPVSDSLISASVTYYRAVGDTVHLSEALFRAGQVNYSLGDFIRATTFFQQAICVTSPGDFERLGLAYRLTGYAYLYRNLPDSALAAHLDALKYGGVGKNNDSRLTFLSDVARAYNGVGQPEKAIQFYLQVADTLKQDSSRSLLSGIQNQTSYIYARMGNFKEALRYAREAKENRLGRDEIPMHNLTIGKIFLQMNQVDSARCYLVKALQSTNRYISNAAYRYIIDLDEKLGDFKNAYDQFRKFSDSSGALNGEINSDVMKRRYEEEKLKNENNLLKLSKRERELYLLWLVIIVLVTASVAYVLYTRERKKRMIKDQLQEELLLKEKAKQLENENLLLKKESELSVLREKDALLRESLFKRMNLSDKIPSLGIFPKDDLEESDRKRIVLTEQDWQELVQTVNDAYDNFAVRLLDTYPALSHNDVAFCCLLKIKITLKDLSDIYCISKASITKKKSRIKKDKLGLDDITHSLDEYLERF